MTISVQELVQQIRPENTVLILGAGVSIPSGAPSAYDLGAKIGEHLGIGSADLTLAEIAGLAEVRSSRSEMIAILRNEFRNLKAKGAILNLPQHDWKSIFSTNYDNLVEQAYFKANRGLKVFSSNFDFTAHNDPTATKLFKIHGTLEKDISDGHTSRMIITDSDYDNTEDYRQALYDRLRSDISPGTNVLIAGQSLSDPDLRDLIQRAITINQKAAAQGRISILLYQRDENRASLFEGRGIKVAFGGLDDLMLEMAKSSPNHVSYLADTGSPLDFSPRLRPVTREIDNEVDPTRANASAIFNGWPADYSDIARGYTFDRKVAMDIADFLDSPDKVCAMLLGGSGVGKTTAARQALLRLKQRGLIAWEHKSDYPFTTRDWLEVAKRLTSDGKRAVVFLDEAHLNLYEVNDLTDLLISEGLTSLKLLLASTRNHWGPRVKTPSMYSKGAEFNLSQLSSVEIDSLLTLVESVPELNKLIESGFGGFSRTERRRRLKDRCEADMFVCMKNIFASEKYDDIILREYSSLPPNCQDIYKYVSVMEHSGIRVHRQMIMRILSIQANVLSALLENLTDIVHEYDVNSRDGIYGWRVRHRVIASIVSKYKFFDIQKIVDLFHIVIDNISPTFDIEIRTIRELCNIESGLSIIPDKNSQNIILRKMMSIAPGERVPRHRLIRNLIELGEFEKAESEIRIFEKDFGKEAPIARYRIQLMIARAIDTIGLQHEDRVVILQQARELAVGSISRYDTNKYVLSTYCELGVETFKLTGSHEVFDDAMKALKKAEGRLGDPEITKMVIRYQRRLSGASTPEFSVEEPPGK